MCWKNTQYLSWRSSITTGGWLRGHGLTKTDLGDTSTKWFYDEEGECSSLNIHYSPSAAEGRMCMPQTSHIVAECSALKRAEYVLWIACWYTQDQLVFVDELSFNCHTAHWNYAWVVKGWRASKNVLCCGKRYMTLWMIFEHLVNIFVGIWSSQH